MGKTNGQIDTAVQSLSEDLLQVSKYVNALSEFVMTCKTPMTISIQGEWGSGKTSFINMMREQLKNAKREDTVLVIPEVFNTWQYSQFDLGSQLPVVLIGKLIKACGGDSKDSKQRILEYVRKAVSVVGNTIDNAVNKYSPVELPFSDMITAICEEKNDAVKTIDHLKELFQSCIDEGIKDEMKKQKKDLSKANGRFIVFIDDLDRLEPVRAVELLEVLKVFMDCRDIVFILAIDYEVVVRGVADKYGNDFERGRQFFDKIIQLPYKMPIAQYKLDSFFERCFKDMDLETDENFRKRCMKITTYSVGYNPRAIKRLINAFQLLRLVSSMDEKPNDKQKDIKDDYDRLFYLFGILCLQLKYEKIYFNFVKAISEIDSDQLEVLINNLKRTGKNDDDQYDSESDYYEKVIKGTEDALLEGVGEWFTVFCDLISKKIDYNMLIDVTTLSSTTSVPEVPVQENKYGEEIRCSLSKIVNQGANKLNGASYTYIQYDDSSVKVGGIKDTTRKLLEKMLEEDEKGFEAAYESLKVELKLFFEGARKDAEGNRILKSPFTVGKYTFCGDFTADKQLKYVLTIADRMNSNVKNAVIVFKPLNRDNQSYR